MAATGEEATRREDAFVRAFEARARACASLLNPLDGKTYPVKEGRFRSSDRTVELIAALKDRGAFSRENVERFPRGTEVTLRLTRRFSRNEVLLVAASATHFQSYLDFELDAGGDSSPAVEPLAAADVTTYLKTVSIGPKTLAVIGLFSASGWLPDILESLASPPYCCLVAPTEGDGWRVVHNLPPALQEFRWFFDPEGKDERFVRLTRMIRERAELGVPGGFVTLQDLRAAVDVDELLFDAILSRVVAEDGRFELVDVDGFRILKHKRV